MKRKNGLGSMLLISAALVVLLVFVSALSNLQEGRISEGRQQLEDAVRRSAVACYAAEGIYPPNLEYLEEHYGIQINWERFDVIYQPIAENLMPDITVIEKS